MLNIEAENRIFTYLHHLQWVFKMVWHEGSEKGFGQSICVSLARTVFLILTYTILQGVLFVWTISHFVIFQDVFFFGLINVETLYIIFSFHLFRQIGGRHQWELVHTQCCPTLQARRNGNDLVESWVLRQVSIWVKCAAMWTTVLGSSMSEHGTWYPWYPFIIVYHNGPPKTCKHAILCTYTYSEYTPFF